MQSKSTCKRPYSLPMASVSNDSVSRDSGFIVNSLESGLIIGHTTPSTLAQLVAAVKIGRREPAVAKTDVPSGRFTGKG